MSETMILERIALAEADTMALASQMARACFKQGIIYLSGDLGAGKTCWVRGFLRGLGYQGQVKSPTYSLVEQYDIAGLTIFHFDLYRLSGPQQIQDLGIRDYCMETSVCIIEWPERGETVLPAADLQCTFEFIPEGRLLRWQANTLAGQTMLEGI